MEGGATTCESYVCGRQSLGVYFTFPLKEGNQAVQYKIGVSYVSVENARENLRLRIPLGTSLRSVRRRKINGMNTSGR